MTSKLAKPSPDSDTARSDAASDAGATRDARLVEAGTSLRDASAPRDSGALRVAHDAAMDPPADADGGEEVRAVVSLAAGAAHAFAVTQGGTAYGWGRDTHGELSDAYTGTDTQPRALGSARKFWGVRAGGASKMTGHSCAIDAGAVLCWGANDDGQLGDGTRQGHTEPRRVSGLSDVTELALASSHSCALRVDGSVLCWGRGPRADFCHVGSRRMRAWADPRRAVRRPAAAVRTFVAANRSRLLSIEPPHASEEGAPWFKITLVTAAWAATSARVE